MTIMGSEPDILPRTNSTESGETVETSQTVETDETQETEIDTQRQTDQPCRSTAVPDVVGDLPPSYHTVVENPSFAMNLESDDQPEGTPPSYDEIHKDKKVKGRRVHFKEFTGPHESTTEESVQTEPDDEPLPLTQKQILARLFANRKDPVMSFQQWCRRRSSV